MRPWSRTTSCWRCSCARHMRASLAESVRLFAHPKTVKEIASVSPIKRKLIKDYSTYQPAKTKNRDGIGMEALVPHERFRYLLLPASSQAEQDRELFRSILDKVCERCGFRVDSSVLMRNHYHLLVENPSPARKCVASTKPRPLNCSRPATGSTPDGIHKPDRHHRKGAAN